MERKKERKKERKEWNPLSLWLHTWVNDDSTFCAVDPILTNISAEVWEWVGVWKERDICQDRERGIGDREGGRVWDREWKRWNKEKEREIIIGGGRDIKWEQIDKDKERQWTRRYAVYKEIAMKNTIYE